MLLSHFTSEIAFWPIREAYRMYSYVNGRQIDYKAHRIHFILQSYTCTSIYVSHLLFSSNGRLYAILFSMCNNFLCSQPSRADWCWCCVSNIHIQTVPLAYHLNAALLIINSLNYLEISSMRKCNGRGTEYQGRKYKVWAWMNEWMIVSWYENEQNHTKNTC